MKQKKDKEQKERDFERLVQEQRQTIYSVCYLFANDRQEADDLAQEVLIRLWQGIDSFEGRSSAKTWVYRVALNTCVTFDKRNRRLRSHQVALVAHPFVRPLFWLDGG